MNFTTEELEHLCFVTRVDLNGTRSTLEDTKNKPGLRFKTTKKVFDPNIVYEDEPNPTKL